ncbi:cell wall metabolism sensor histidine kinase WalK [uncultured Ruminococcus sp.]|uniref:sensor histidine kinase n=1 Tax=uncultured Ruminococcus sp. TaxID=165186 RepID=UPI00266F6E5E|nr:HAMP domain-containing sensor histidine kinase [uncultured Ruminococcus sp.]
MIRRVRRQFICITMAMLTTVLLIPLIALNVITEAMSYNQTRNLLEQIAISETAVRQMPDGAPPDGKRLQETTDAVPAAGSDTSTETTVTTTASTTTTAETTTVQTERAPAETKAAGSGAPAPAAVQTQPPTPRQTAAPKATTAAPRATTARQTKAPVTTTKAIVSRETKPAATQPPQPDPPRQTEPDLPPDPPPWWGWDDPPHDYKDNRENYAARQPVLYAMPLASLAQSVPMNDGGRKAPPFPDKRGDVVTIDHFLCFANGEGTLMRLDGTENYTEDDAQTMLDYVLEKGKTDGWYGSLQYFRKNYDRGTLVVFSDRSAEQLLLHKVLLVSILVFLLMEGVVFLLTMILTKRAMRPMQETFERQRQFISDAGHELKTPLTIISANVDILHDEIGENKWLSYIQSQAERMRVLVGEMMNLTKLEMGDKEKDFVDFSLSEAVSGAALPFEGQAFEQKKQLELEIQEDISYHGNPDQIKQLVGIFMDNALKYSKEHGEIRVTLQQVQNKKTLKVYNTGKGIPESEKEKIFQRFYRSDASRARSTGGYGLGLSIAQSIADAHKIRIQVESEYEHWICFILTF